MSKGSEPENINDDEIRDDEADEDSEFDDITSVVEPVVGKDEEEKSQVLAELADVERETEGI